MCYNFPIIFLFCCLLPRDSSMLPISSEEHQQISKFTRVHKYYRNIACITRLWIIFSLYLRGRGAGFVRINTIKNITWCLTVVHNKTFSTVVPNAQWEFLGLWWSQSKIIRYKAKWTRPQHFSGNGCTLKYTSERFCRVFFWFFFCFCKVVLPNFYNTFWIKDLRPLKPMTWLTFIIAIRFTAQSSENKSLMPLLRVTDILRNMYLLWPIGLKFDSCWIITLTKAICNISTKPLGIL